MKSIENRKNLDSVDRPVYNFAESSHLPFKKH